MSETQPLRVLLAGFNLDRDTLAQLEQAAYDGGEPPPRDTLTPETISAAYARISRNPAEVPEIRAKARLEVEKARKSNENIIFGLGHSSVAEHAVFNFDVVGISRFAVESVEYHRLVSFTEKSQRYIKLDGDFTIPSELREAGFEEGFRSLIARQNEAYFSMHPKLTEYFLPIVEAEGSDKPDRDARSRAAEDARYVVSLATLAQFGMTINARTLEAMARRCGASPLDEVRFFAGELLKAVHGIAPSLVKYVHPTEYERSNIERLPAWKSSGHEFREEVNLVTFDLDGETKVLAALFARNQGVDYRQAEATILGWDRERKSDLVRSLLKNASPWDQPPREFELAHFTYEIVLSAAAYGQLKRHRMASLLTGPYDPGLGWTTPDSIRDAGLQAEFDAILEESAVFAGKIAERCPIAAPYALCNAHRRRVLFHANAREMAHVSRLREDLHAQWDIRAIAGKMVHLAREAMPSLFLLAAGKHDFEAKKREVYGS